MANQTQSEETDALAILIPARNEAETLAGALAAAANSGADVIVVIDDNSDDGTAEIARAWAARDPRIRVIAAGPLPSDWTGKNHALWRGVAALDGQPACDWLLFLDADTRLLPRGLQAALALAKERGLDALSLSPEQDTLSFWERAVVPAVYAELERKFPYARVNDPADACAAANGQFLLVRRAAYDRIGGHSAVRGEVLEDVRLAERIKRAGLRYLFLPGNGWVRTRMYRDLKSQWQGWSKNFYPLLGQPTLLDSLRLLAPTLVTGIGLYAVLNRRGLLAATMASVLLAMHAASPNPRRRTGLFAPVLWVVGDAMKISIWWNSWLHYRMRFPLGWRGRRVEVARGRKELISACESRRT